MPRVSPFRSFGLVLLLLLPALPLALLCRGRTPTRFDAKNLPVWEQPTHVVHHFSGERPAALGFHARAGGELHF